MSERPKSHRSGNWTEFMAGSRIRLSNLRLWPFIVLIPTLSGPSNLENSGIKPEFYQILQRDSQENPSHPKGQNQKTDSNNRNPSFPTPIKRWSDDHKASLPLIQARSVRELSKKTLEHLSLNPDWPSYLTPKYLRLLPFSGFLSKDNKELFMIYDLKMNGFSLRRHSLRIWAREVTPQTFLITHVQHHRLFHPPLDGTSTSHHTPVEVNTEAQAHQILDNYLHSETLQRPWRTQAEWRRLNHEWYPFWKIELLGSPKTYFVDAQSGEVSFQESQHGLSQKVLIAGRGTPMLELPMVSTLFPLPGSTLHDEQGKTILTADSQGYVDSEQLRPQEHYKINLNHPLLEIINKDIPRKHSTPVTLLPAHWEEFLFPPATLPQSALVVNPLNMGPLTAQINVFHYIEFAKAELSKVLGVQTPLTRQKLVVQVNIPNEMCEASYKNGMLFFDNESDECRNTAYDTIILHEVTHFIDDIYGGIMDSALSEGLGDIVATFLTNQPIIGRGLFKKFNAYMRSVENEVVYKEINPPRDLDHPRANLNELQMDTPHLDDSETDFEENKRIAYSNALAFAGFAWDARKELINKYGGVHGSIHAAHLFLSLLETNPPDIPAAIDELFSRMTSGHESARTPDFDILDKAAMKHGFFWLNKKNGP